MIVVEGVDGSGKSTLINSLSYELKLKVHPRASSSVGGPVKDIFGWAARDLDQWHQQSTPHIYDRHPLISEPIYGPVVRGHLDHRFSTPEGRRIQQMFKELSLVILCKPPIQEVMSNISDPLHDQMDGVADHAAALYHLYAFWVPTAHQNVAMYNYCDETHNSYRAVVAACRLHVARWMRR